MFRRSLVAAVVVLALVSSATASLAGGGQDEQGGCHLQADRGSQEEPCPGGREEACGFGSNQTGRRRSCRSRGHAEQALYGSPRQWRPLPCRGRIDSSCKGSCDASYRISGSANHKLKVVPSCQPNGSGFVCSKVKIVKVYDDRRPVIHTQGQTPRTASRSGRRSARSGDIPEHWRSPRRWRLYVWIAAVVISLTPVGIHQLVDRRRVGWQQRVAQQQLGVGLHGKTGNLVPEPGGCHSG